MNNIGNGGPTVTRILLFAGLLFFACNAKSAKIGADSILTGEAGWIEGTIQRIAYAPGTTQSLSYDGTWSAVLSDKGRRIVTSVGPVKREASFIGDDQIGLETRNGTVQSGTIRHFNADAGPAGQDFIFVQYLLERIQAANKQSNQAVSQTYAKTWFHIADALKADVEAGVDWNRVHQNGIIQDKWYVSRYIEKRFDGDRSGGQIVWPGYATNGFLAVEVSMRLGEFTPGEVMTINEYWPKSSPTSCDDVDLFRHTEITVIAVKKVDSVNLLPKVTDGHARVEDFRFMMDSAKLKPLNLPLKPLGWVLAGSSQWKTFTEQVALLKDSGAGYLDESITKDRRMTARLVVLTTMLLSIVALTLVIFRVSVKNKHKQ
jgi:hypothetical protein